MQDLGASSFDGRLCCQHQGSRLILLAYGPLFLFFCIIAITSEWTGKFRRTSRRSLRSCERKGLGPGGALEKSVRARPRDSMATLAHAFLFDLADLRNAWRLAPCCLLPDGCQVPMSAVDVPSLR